MALERVEVNSWWARYTKEAYERKKRDIFAKQYDPKTEKIWNGMIYCKFCHYPKVADFPERNFVTKCCCQCEIERYKRQKQRMAKPPKAQEIAKGDWNPFD